MVNKDSVKVLDRLENQVLKTATYGANLARPLASKVVLDISDSHINGFDAGSVVAPLYFAVLESLGVFVPEIKESSLYRSSKIAGTVGFGISAGVNVYNFLNGDANCGVKAVLDASMSYQLFKDSVKEYCKTGEYFFRDLKTVNKNAVDSFSNFFRNLRR